MRIVVLTGAGVSAESGLGTFRGRDGTWSNVDIETVATPAAYAADPARVHRFYDARRRQLRDIEPNAAHHALAELEAALAARGGRLTLVTQNVDDLHERAGSRAVIHMHGELRRARCTGCGAIHRWEDDLIGDAGGTGRGAPCPRCLAPLRPHVVWFGEVPFATDAIESALGEADLFAAIGTSGVVYPAAGYVSLARSLGVHTVEVNLEPSDSAGLFDEGVYGTATATVRSFVDALLAPRPSSSAPTSSSAS